MRAAATGESFCYDGVERSETIVADLTAVVDVEACRQYVLGRQTKDGGFCFYACPEWGVEEPNAPDTYAAIAILGLLNWPLPMVEQCVVWLQGEQDPCGGYPTFVIGHAALEALRLLGRQPKRDPHSFLDEAGNRLGLVHPGRPKARRWLVSVLHCIELWHDHGMGITEPIRNGIKASLRDLCQPDGGYGESGSNLPDTAAALALATATDLPVERDSILSYVQRCQGGPYGFNITPHAISSSLEVQHAGLYILKHFDLRPRDVTALQDFVAGCQSAAGGFGRVPGAIPRLDDSLRALQILSMLA